MRLLIALLFLLPSPAFAFTCATQFASNDGMRFGVDETTERAGATQFTPTLDCYVTGISVRARLEGSPSDNLSLQIWSSSANAPGTIIATGTNLSLTSTYSWATSTFSAGPTLVSGTPYFIVLVRSGAASITNYYRWGGQDSNVGGFFYHGFNGGWFLWDVAGASGQYVVEGTTAPVAAPYNYWSMWWW